MEGLLCLAFGQTSDTYRARFKDGEPEIRVKGKENRQRYRYIQTIESAMRHSVSFTALIKHKTHFSRTTHAAAALLLCIVASDCTMLLKLASSSTGLEPSQRAFALNSLHNSSISHSLNPWYCRIFSQARPISI